MQILYIQTVLTKGYETNKITTLEINSNFRKNEYL